MISYVPQDTSYLKGSLSDFAEKSGIEEPLFKAVLRKMFMLYHCLKNINILSAISAHLNHPGGHHIPKRPIMLHKKGGLFEGLSIWEAEAYRNLQGTYPVISLSFAAVKETCFSEARKSLCRMIEEQYNKYEFLLEKNLLNDKERAFYQEVTAGMSDSAASAALRMLSDFLYRLYGKKVIILLDEYDTPMLMLLPPK